MTIIEIEYIACKIASIGSFIALIVSGILGLPLQSFLFGTLFIGSTVEWIWLNSVMENKDAKVS